MKKDDKIFVAGHKGMVGSAILRKLQNNGFSNLIYRSSSELDLRQQDIVAEFFKEHKPDYVFLAAAKVGGILANNTYRAEFIYNNLMIQCNVIHQSYLNKVKKLLFLGSNCIYPKFAELPIKEESLLGGYLEPTNQPYAVAKIAGLEMCKAYHHQYNCQFFSAMPTNLYGPNDNYDLETSHVLPALIRKVHEAKKYQKEAVVIWGTGSPRREFLHVDDLAEACYYLMEHYASPDIINVGTGIDLTILELAQKIKAIVGYEGAIKTDPSKPDGTPRKIMNVDKIHNLGWKAKIDLDSGIARVYEELKSEPWY